MKKYLLILLSLLLVVSPAFTQSNERDREWNRPVEPFKIIGNIYYVGASEVTSFLVVTPKGHFLLDGGFKETSPLILESIKKLGFNIKDIKYLLNSQAHNDHAGGLADLKRLTGAKMAASAADKIQLEKGGKDDFAWGDELAFDAVKVDRVIKDGKDMRLGGVKITPVITPGHTKGCTTWVMSVKENGKSYQVVFVGGTSAPGYNLVKNEKYPGIVADYEKTFARLMALKADVFLGAHGGYFDLLDKIEKMRKDKSTNHFIDPEGYKAFIAGAKESFAENLKKQAEENDKKGN
jgi:metallo-beta-lactamase class B